MELIHPPNAHYGIYIICSILLQFKYNLLLSNQLHMQVNLAAAQKSIAAGDTVKQPLKFEGAMSAEAQMPEETPIKHHVTESTVADGRNNVVHHLTKEFEQQKQVFEDDACVLSEVNSGQLGSVAKSIEELRNLTIRYEAWKKEYKVHLRDAKASLLKLGKSEGEKSRRRWWYKKKKRN